MQKKWVGTVLIGNVFFKKGNIRKYTWMCRNGEQTALMDYVLTDRWGKGMLIDVNVLRRVAEGLLEKLKVACGYVKTSKEVKKKWSL